MWEDVKMWDAARAANNRLFVQIMRSLAEYAHDCRHLHVDGNRMIRMYIYIYTHTDNIYIYIHTDYIYIIYIYIYTYIIYNIYIFTKFQVIKLTAHLIEVCIEFDHVWWTHCTLNWSVQWIWPYLVNLLHPLLKCALSLTMYVSRRASKVDLRGGASIYMVPPPEIYLRAFWYMVSTCIYI